MMFDSAAAAGSGCQVGASSKGADAGARARTGTLRRSCEACRALKARCIMEPPSPPHQRRCQRCACNGLECVFEEALARPKRPRPATRTRVKDVEDKIDSLISLIAARNETAKSVDLLAMNQASETHASLLPPPPFSVDSIFPTLDFPITPPVSEPSISPHDVFGKGIVPIETGERLLAVFAAEAGAMPYIALAPHMTFEYLRRERPCLLLAAMVSNAESPLQEKLAHEFRQFVAQKVIVEGKKNIDMIQGIIVFCIWHHRVYNPNVLQLYQLSQLAVTMAVDLGLPQLAHLSGLDLQKPGVTRSSWVNNPQYWDELERIRTYLGCYCISHCIAISVRKPTRMKHSRRIEEAGKLISDLNVGPSDGLVIHYLRIQRFMEEVEAVFHYNDPDGMDEMDGWKIHVMAKTFERKLAQLKESMPPEVLDISCIKLAFLFLRVYINEIGLHVPPGHGNKPDCCDWCGSPYRAELVISCVRASQVYLDTYLALPDEVIKSLNVMEIGRHLYAILLLGRVAMRQDLSSLASILRGELANIKAYLCASQRKTASLVTYMADGQPKKDSYWQLQILFDTAVSMYDIWREKPEMFVGDDCGLALGLDELMDPANQAECMDGLPQITPQQPTPDSQTAWMGDQDVMLSSLATLSPPPAWFDF